MTPYHNGGLFALGMTANKYTGNDWVFQGNTTLEPVYEGNFDADIDAIAESTGDDSGYYSNDADSFEASNDDVAHYENRPSTSSFQDQTAKVPHPTSFYADVPASNKSNHGSIYSGTLNKSTTYLERGTSYGKQPKETRISKTLYHPMHEYEHKTPHKYSAVNVESSGPRPIESWASTHERHEWIAYRLEQTPDSPSGKRRKSGSRK